MTLMLIATTLLPRLQHRETGFHTPRSASDPRDREVWRQRVLELAICSFYASVSSLIVAKIL